MALAVSDTCICLATRPGGYVRAVLVAGRLWFETGTQPFDCTAAEAAALAVGLRALAERAAATEATENQETTKDAKGTKQSTAEE